MTEKLSGAFIELYKVVDPGGTETETLIALTKDDIDIDFDVTEMSTRPHSEEVETQQPVGWGQEVSFTGLVASSLGALADLGVMDSDVLRGFGKAKLEALRLKVFEAKGDTTEKQRILLNDCWVILDSISYPGEDFAEWTGKALVNGTIDKETIV